MQSSWTTHQTGKRTHSLESALLMDPWILESIERLQYTIKTLKYQPLTNPIHLTFEEHPSSNKEKLQYTLDIHDIMVQGKYTT